MTSDSPISSLNEPWLQLPPKAGKGGATETLINHEAFLIYRDLPPSEQSIARVAQSLGKNEKLLEKWSSKFFWRERASAWRRRLQEIEAEERQQQAREQEQRRMQREQEFHELKHELGDELIAKGRTLLKLPATERVIGKQDGGSVTVRPNRAANQAVDVLRFGIELKEKAFASEKSRTTPIQEAIDYDLNSLTPTVDSTPQNSTSSAAQSGAVPEVSSK